jgi:hypothetical protein
MPLAASRFIESLSEKQRAATVQTRVKGRDNLFYMLPAARLQQVLPPGAAKTVESAAAAGGAAAQARLGWLIRVRE